MKAASQADPSPWWYWLWLALALGLYFALASWQLGLPGIHYDEAREAGVNAMELLTGAPVTAFRDGALQVGNVRLPLMVQDYIGALYVYLSLPFLWLSGIGVPNLRIVSVLVGAITLVLLERSVSEWLIFSRTGSAAGKSKRVPLSAGGLSALTVAAASPAFVFWSRQGVFVTNLMTLFVLASLWLGVRWMRTNRRRDLILCALAAGLALYAKLLAFWVLLPFALLLGWGYLRQWRRGERSPLTVGDILWSLVALALPLLPLLLFNLQTGGTWQALTGNLGRSYYGVENRALFVNLLVRLPQVKQVLEGSFFWYLGGIESNPLAPWLAGGLVIAGLLLSWQRLLPPLILVLGTFLLSLVTISDLFITHYALLQVVLLGVVGVAAGILFEQRRATGARRWAAVTLSAILALWVLLDLRAVVGYHRLLATTGGLADHSDASYDLAYHLRYNGLGAPIALDWGMDAPIRFLTEGSVTPIEIFGYGSPDMPDEGFDDRLLQFAPNPQNVYLLHAPGAEVFAGRRAVFEERAASLNLQPRLEAQFSQRDGTPLYELWRLEPQQEPGR